MIPILSVLWPAPAVAQEPPEPVDLGQMITDRISPLRPVTTFHRVQYAVPKVEVETHWPSAPKRFWEAPPPHELTARRLADEVAARSAELNECVSHSPAPARNAS